MHRFSAYLSRVIATGLQYRPEDVINLLPATQLTEADALLRSVRLRVPSDEMPAPPRRSLSSDVASPLKSRLPLMIPPEGAPDSPKSSTA